MFKTLFSLVIHMKNVHRKDVQALVFYFTRSKNYKITPGDSSSAVVAIDLVLYFSYLVSLYLRKILRAGDYTWLKCGQYGFMNGVLYHESIK
jgi:hypothetical protein